MIGSALEQLIAHIDLDFSLPASEVPHAIRNRLQAALQAPDLYLDCAHLALSQMAFMPDARFLFRDPESRYTLQMFCWPPGFGNEPHLHTNWTVSGIMASSLLIFRSAASETDCLASEPLLATAGQAGFLIPPQFHCLRNIGDDCAITFHIFSVDAAHDERLHSEARAISSTRRLDDDGILAIAAVAARHGGPRAIEIVRNAFTAVANAAKLDAVKLMVKLDPPGALQMARTLSTLVGGRDGARLLQFVERLEIAAHDGSI